MQPLKEKNNFHSTSGPIASKRGWVIPQGRNQTLPHPIKPRPPTRPRPRYVKPRPVTEAPPQGRRGCCAWRPAGALEIWGSGLGERPDWGGAGCGEGGAAGRGGRKERQAGRRHRRAGGRSGPGATGPERQSRHDRQREAQPGLYHRAPARRSARAGEVGARCALTPGLARKWRAGGLAPPRPA